MKNQRGAIPVSEHAEKKRMAKSRKKKSGLTRPRRGFIMDGRDSSYRGGCVHSEDHVAQYYQKTLQSPGVAANLVVGLRPWAQRAVLGAGVQI
jgi:hypothetical protein